MSFDPKAFIAQHGADVLRGVGRNTLIARYGLNARQAQSVRKVMVESGHDDKLIGRAPRDLGDHTSADEREAAKIDSTSYTFDEARDAYTFVWAKQTRPLTLSGASVRAMIADYVKDGGDLSMHAVAVRHGVTRRDFERIKCALSITKNHEPFTPEVLAEAPEDDLLAQTLASKRQRLALRAETADLRQIRDWAARWVQFQDGTLDPLAERLDDLLAGRPLVVRSAPPAPSSRDAVIVHLHASDLHYGLYASRAYGHAFSDGYDRTTARQRMLQATADTIAWAGRLLRPIDYFVMPAGGDMVHCDNVAGKTSSFKNQMDLDGVPEEILLGAIDLYIEAVEMVLAAGHRVHIEMVPGNHDALLSVVIAKSAALRFRDDARVSVGNLIAPYAFHRYGDVVLLEHHGDGVKSGQDLAELLKVWTQRTGERYRWSYALTGNLHHVKVDEDAGIYVIQQPSPAENDRWHVKNGFVTSRPAVLALAFSSRYGLVEQKFTYFD